jgi:hypothetical protein
MTSKRRVFSHDGKQCYVIAELSTSNAKGLNTLLSVMGPIASVPIECRQNDMRLSGMSTGHDFYIDITLNPLMGGNEQTYVDTTVDNDDFDIMDSDINTIVAQAVSASNVSSDANVSAVPWSTLPTAEAAAAPAGKKRKRPTGTPLEVYSGEPPTVSPQTVTDYYRRYDDHDVSVQVDIDCLLHMTNVAKRAVSLQIIVYSFSISGEPERILVSSCDRNTTTFGIVTPQILECDVWSLPSFKAVATVVMAAEDLSDHIKAVSTASQAAVISIQMTGNQAAAVAQSKPQSFTLSAVGDTGTIRRVIQSDRVANVTFINNKELASDDVINFTGRYASRPLVAIGKIASICRYVRMYLVPERPLKLHYTIPDLGNLFFFMCPKNDDYEED